MNWISAERYVGAVDVIDWSASSCGWPSLTVSCTSQAHLLTYLPGIGHQTGSISGGTKQAGEWYTRLVFFGGGGPVVVWVSSFTTVVFALLAAAALPTAADCLAVAVLRSLSFTGTVFTFLSAAVDWSDKTKPESAKIWQSTAGLVQ